MKKLPPEISIKALTNTVPINIDFDFPEPEVCLVNRKALYALIGPSRSRVATFILQANITISFKPSTQVKMTVSMPVFSGEGQKTFEERAEFYRFMKGLIP